MQDKTKDGKELAAAKGRVVSWTCGEHAQDLARGGEKRVRWGRERETHLADTGHAEVRVAAKKPGAGLTYGDGKFLEIIVGFERGIGGDKVGEGGGEESIFVII
jgi:hypothetical protein